MNVKQVLEGTLALTERQLKSSGVNIIRKWEYGQYTVNGSAFGGVDYTNDDTRDRA